MFGYIYRIHNLVNQKMYIGQHKSQKLDEKYLGSSPLLKKSIQKYGKENFTIEILEWCESKEELNLKEIYWIDFYDAINNRQYYNVNAGGKGGFDYINKNRLAPSCNKLTHPMYNKKGKDNPNYGKTMSEEQKKKLSEINKGKIAINNGKINKWVYDESQIPNGWEKGLIKKSSWDEERQKQHSESIKGRKFVHNDKEIKLVKAELVDYYLQQGYVLGKSINKISNNNTPMYNKKHTDETKQKMSNSRKGNFLWINNGIKNLRVSPDKLDDYLLKGYIRGRIKK